MQTQLNITKKWYDIIGFMFMCYFFVLTEINNLVLLKRTQETFAFNFWAIICLVSMIWLIFIFIRWLYAE